MEEFFNTLFILAAAFVGYHVGVYVGENKRREYEDDS